MAEPIKPPKWFCRNISTGGAEGPFDLVELAGLLRSGGITGQTLVRAEGDEGWVAFQDMREFESAKHMPADVIYQHLKDETENQESPWGLRRLYYLCALVFGTLGYWFHLGAGWSTRLNEFLSVVFAGLKHFLRH